MSSKPRTLEELLREFNALKHSPSLDLDTLIKSKTWSCRFVEKHLQPREQEDLITALKFMALTQPINHHAQHLLSGAKSKKKISSAQRKELTQIVLQAAKVFFDIKNEETALPLKNQDYFKRVNDVRKRLEKSPKETATDSDLKLILQVREDVQADDLEDQFKEFIVKAGPDGPLACLLSIL